MALPDPTTVSGPAGERLTIPTHEGSGQSTHPSVVHIPGGVNGFKYWMAVTPYPGSSNAHEDPNVLASHDGITWEVPPGLVNPIDNQPGGDAGYNSDTDLQYVDDTLFLFWRTYINNNVGAEENLYYSTSGDGITWSPKTLYYQSDRNVRRLASPCMLYESGAWAMWAVDIAPDTFQVVRLQGGALPETGWSAPVVVDMGPMQSGKQPWHLGLIRTADGYIALLNDTLNDLFGTDGDLLFCVSTDGLTWTNSGHTVIPHSSPGQYDALYRATLLPETVGGVPGWRVWYGADLLGPPAVWNIFRTWISAGGGINPEPDPSAPPVYADPQIRQEVTWLGIHRTTGRIIAELPDVTASPKLQLSAYASTSLSIPLDGTVPIQQLDAITDGRLGAIVAVVNNMPIWMGLPANRHRGTDPELHVPSCNTPESYFLKRRVKDAVFVDVDRARVALALAQQAEAIDGIGQGLDLEYDVKDTGDLISIEYKTTDRIRVYDALRDLCVAGLEFTIRLDWADATQTRIVKILEIGRRVGVLDVVNPPVFDTDGSVISYTLHESWAEDEYANHITAIGPGQGDDQPASAPAVNLPALVSGIPVVESVISPGNNIADVPTLQAHADADLVRRQAGADALDITASLYDSPRPGIDARMGFLMGFRLDGPGHPAPTVEDPTDHALTGSRRLTSMVINPNQGTWAPGLVPDPTLELV
jgi:hypothetical protein